MPAPNTNDELLALVRKSGLVDPARLTAALELPSSHERPDTPKQLAALLVRRGCITLFQAEQFLLGKWRGFTIGKYKVLERLGSGGCGTVYLCEHVLVQRKVAVKVLPTSRADNPAALGRFYREARAAGRLNHPNLVKCHDVDEENGLHFLVLDYVDGTSLHELISRFGRLSVPRAANYIRQAALGLQAAHEAGLIHRDVKPANILLDRNGVIRVLDLGLARFFADEDDPLTLKYDENNVLGTADYVAPEQALNSHDVDIRADVYSLGATFYFLLVGHPPFPDGKAPQKLIWHQVKQPTPIRRLRAEIPQKMATVLERMMAKDPAQRQQSPGEVAENLSAWAQVELGPPSEREMPKLSRAALAVGGDAGHITPTRLALPDSGKRARGIPTAEMRARGLEGRQTQHELPTPRQPSFAELAMPSPLASPTLQEDGTKDDAGSPRSSRGASPRPAARRDPLTPNARAIRLAILLLLSGVVGAWLRSAMPQARPPAASAPALWTVSRNAAPNVLPSIAAALKLARPGDLIRVVDDTWEELLDWRGENGAAEDVTVEGAAPGGRVVVWRSPAAGGADKPLLTISNVAGAHLRNFALDGRDRLDELISVSGTCPGLVLEDLRLTGFRVRGVALQRCVDDANRPVELRRLDVPPGRPVTDDARFLRRPPAGGETPAADPKAPDDRLPRP
jgi:serine/threonine protein kinase